MRRSPLALIRRLGTVAAVVALGAAVRLVGGVGFANYDTLYALVWGQQLARGQTPEYGVAIAPTPHPLIEVLGLVLSPLGPAGAQAVTVALGLAALGACAWVLYALGRTWFSAAVGALAAVILITRVPVLSYGVRAYVDVPYMLFVLAALLVETRRPRAGAPVLALLALAGLLRPEAWVFSALYWGWCGLGRDRSIGQMARLTLLAASAPLLWVASDWLVTGNPVWSLTNTRHTASALRRITGVANVPQYIPRRIGEILRPPVLAGAALGGVLSLLWLRERARPGAAAGAIAVVVFALFASFGLPINTRYAFLVSAILCVYCGVGVFGWMLLPRADPRRRLWLAGACLVVVALLAYAPSQYRGARVQLRSLAFYQRTEQDLTALVDRGAINSRCAPVGVPNHAPVPLLALWLKTAPGDVVSEEAGGRLTRGTYIDPASGAVLTGYVLDRNDPNQVRHPVPPPGFALRARNRSWLIYQRCR
jgi:hypothetical protein